MEKMIWASGSDESELLGTAGLKIVDVDVDRALISFGRRMWKASTELWLIVCARWFLPSTLCWASSARLFALFSPQTLNVAAEVEQLSTQTVYPSNTHEHANHRRIVTPSLTSLQYSHWTTNTLPVCRKKNNSKLFLLLPFLFDACLFLSNVADLVIERATAPPPRPAVSETAFDLPLILN